MTESQLGTFIAGAAENIRKFIASPSAQLNSCAHLTHNYIAVWATSPPPTPTRNGCSLAPSSSSSCVSRDSLICGQLHSESKQLFRARSTEAGFAMLEVGSIQIKNTKNILMKNLLDACVGALVWWSIGFYIAVSARLHTRERILVCRARAFRKDH